ncbi:hypothetical protein FisN_5Hh090 [Fistulifera solaris]|uniref:HIG1 domain-containing protein n=1 Tax=Fistulifera solaris TaxID=1519565 RepID=A0A1Z5JUA9_FISSO|nr:hypothetical protein FisN_5Hh090 [Fistulifera solaris]|eukprot:GAX17442.1 hypothetical protein FisN_5Hh090 [Fistulifera solaris]
MSSLTPNERRHDVAWDATYEGLVNGAITLIPSSAAVFAALQYPAFRARTNVQSRTALIIMPALFMFGYTSEHKLSNRMKEIANENRHSADTVLWAERQLQHRATKAAELKEEFNANAHLNELYQQSISQSGVRIVPGHELNTYHRAANYAAENPIKVLAGFAIPAVASIFYGRSGKEHLELSSKLMHTRVYGQFATITLLLSVMGFKEFMDRNGKFITEADAMARVEEMHRIRTELMERLHHEREVQDEARRELLAAHAEVEASKKKKSKKHTTDQHQTTTL